MFSLVTFLTALPWRLIGAGAIAVALVVGGCQFGEKRVTAEWDAEKVATAQAVAKQVAPVAAVTAQQSTINQKISNDFQKAKAAIATDGRILLARIPQRVRVVASHDDSVFPAVSEPASRVDAATADPVLAAPSAACYTLTEDAAHTTLMVLEFQRWWWAQAGEF